MACGKGVPEEDAPGNRRHQLCGRVRNLQRLTRAPVNDYLRRRTGQDRGGLLAFPQRRLCRRRGDVLAGASSGSGCRADLRPRLTNPASILPPRRQPAECDRRRCLSHRPLEHQGVRLQSPGRRPRCWSRATGVPAGRRESLQGGAGGERREHRKCFFNSGGLYC